MTYLDQVQLADGARALWKLDETSGTVLNDASGNARNGTINTGATLGAPALVAEGGTAITGGTNGIGDIPAAAWMEGLTGLTVEAWVKPTSNTIYGRSLVGRYATGIAGSWILWQSNTDPAKFGWLVRDTSDRQAISSTTFTVGQTYHVVGTCDGVTARLYVNGVQTASVAVTSSWSAKTLNIPIQIGRWNSGNASLATEDQVAIYPTALSAAQVQTHYLAGLGRQVVNLATYSGEGQLEAGPTVKGVGFYSEGTLVVDGQVQTESISAVAAFGGAGTLTVTGHRVSLPQLVVQILNPNLGRAPTAVTVVVVGAWPGKMLDFYIDGDYTWSARADADGMLRPTSLDVHSGSSGSHIVRVEQSNAIFGQATFTLRDDDDHRRGEDDPDFPIAMGEDADPVDIPDAYRPNGTRAWVWQDLYPSEHGGIGSWVMPINPDTMSNPYYERRYTVHPTTVPVRPYGNGGQFHVMEGMDVPKEWTFEGWVPTKAIQNTMLRYRNLNRRFYIIDHHKRAWKVHITNIEFTAHRHQDYAIAPQDTKMRCTEWGHDYKVFATVLSQHSVDVT